MSDAPVPADRPASALPRWKRRLRGVAVLLAAGALLSAPWWARAALASLDYFRVRTVEVQGVRYASVADLVDALGVDTTRSVWDDVAPLVRRLETHPLVRSASVSRRLPGTLVLQVEEEPPVALVAGGTGLEPVDEAGLVLPLDPSRVPTDLPIIARADSGVLRLLAEVRRENPELFRRISEVRQVAADELIVRFASFQVRTSAAVSAERLADALPVAEDLDRRGLRAEELDLRFRHQVIARLQ